MKNAFSSFLDGARKEAKEPLAKFNARDESRSLMPVDGATRHQKSRHSSPPERLAGRAFPFAQSSEISLPPTSIGITKL